MKTVTVHTDGGCQGNPGPGGWGAVLDFRGQRKEISGGEPATTNNRMELRAAIAALAVLKEPCQVELFTDSEYLRDGISKWLPNWKRNGWKTAAKKPVKNDDLWRELDGLAAGHRIVWRWLKGHAGHALNERCDWLANAQMEKIRSTHTAGQLRALRDEFSARQAGVARGGNSGLFG